MSLSDSSNHYRLVESLYQRAVDLPAERRLEFLSSQCGGDVGLRREVETLIEHYESADDSFLAQPLHNLGRFQVPARVGPYRLLDVLGEGGMGIVYRAEQDNPRRVVAVKLIKPGLASSHVLKRFEYEAHVLGCLRHVGVAQIYEAGAETIGGLLLPFFAMELVDGQTLGRFATDRQLDLRSKLELIARVCDAIHHAHQKGVIHRDLKPGNILVAEDGQPKVLDFGVARVTDASGPSLTLQTGAGQLLGTLSYMSPEQFSGDGSAVDTRSDVYSLGVIAYELVTGRPPIDVAGKSLPQAIRILSESEPAPAGAVRAELRGDVEAILSKAIEKRSDRRYASAADLATDIRRFLNHQAVAARPASAAYLAARFARRNRGLVIAASVTAFTLLAGAVGTGVFAWRANREAEHARAQAGRANATIQLLREMLSSVDPRAARGREITMRDMLDEAARRIDGGDLANQPELEAVLRSTIGEAYLHLGKYTEARPHLEAALDRFTSLYGPRHDDVIANSMFLASALLGLGEFDEAERLDRAALDAARALYGESHRQVASCLGELGMALATRNRLVEAEACYRQSLVMRRTLPDVTSNELSRSMNDLGTIQLRLGRIQEAEPLLRETLVIRRESLPPDHPDLATALNNLGTLLQKRGELDEAEALLTEALAIRRRALPPMHPDLAISLNNMAGILRARGRQSETIPYYREAIDIQRSSNGSPDPDLGKTLLNLSVALRETGDVEGADRAGHEAIDLLRRTFGEDDPNVAAALHNLAFSYRDAGDPATAEQMLRDGLRIFEKRLPPDHVMIAHSRDSLGSILILEERYEEALPLLEQALTQRRQSLGENHPQVGLTWAQVSVARLRLRQPEQAAEAAAAAIAIFRKHNPTGPNMGVALLTLAEARLAADRPGREPSEINTLIQESMTIRHDAFGDESWQMADARRVQGQWLMHDGRFADAEIALLGAYESLERRTAPAEFQARQSLHLTVEALAKLYVAWGQPERAAQWSDRGPTG